MEPAVQELLRDFFHEANVQVAASDIDLALQRLVDDIHSDSAVCKRDLRRLLERDPAGFFQSAGRILKGGVETTGVGPLLESLWSSPLLLNGLIDPGTLSLHTATALAKRWVAFDPMLDIKLLQMGFPLGEDDVVWAADLVRPKRALDIVSELPPNRHVLLAVAKLLRHGDSHIRSKAALLYSRASKNPDWVRKMLAEPDARVRANAVEGLWENRSPFAIALFKEAALDPDHRVAANALVGLHGCSEERGEVLDLVQNMARNADPLARSAAAFVMGQIMDGNCTPILEKLLHDGDQGVRGQALRSLIRLRRQERHEAAPAVAAEEPSPVETSTVAVLPNAGAEPHAELRAS